MTLDRRLSKLEASILPEDRPWKVVTVRRRLEEGGDAAVDRHFAAYPEDQDANVVIFHFLRCDEEMADGARIASRTVAQGVSNGPGV